MSIRRRPDRNNRWEVSWYEDGKRYRKLLPKTKTVFDYDVLTGKPIAKQVPLTEEEARWAELKLRQGASLSATPSQGGCFNPRLAEILPDFMRWLKNHRRPRTYQDYQSVISRLLGPAFGDKRLDEIDESALDIYKQTRLNSNHKKKLVASINKELMYLSGILKWARKRKYTAHKPDIEKLKYSPKLPQIPSPDAIQKLLQAAEAPYKPFLMVLYYTGSRWDAARTLRWEQLDFERGIIFFPSTKGGKPLILPLHTILAVELKELWKARGGPAEGLVFISPRTGRRYDNIVGPIKRACDKVGITSKITPHTFRHAFATHLLLQGVDIRKVQILLGHEQITTTQIYTRLASELLSADVAKLGGGV